MDDNDINFNAIDFETATGKRDSACSVAIITVKQAEIVNKWSTLIKPPNNYYSQRNIDVHGIQPHQTENAKPFSIVYKDIYNIIAGQSIVAHNASFDKSVLDASIKSFGITDIDKLPAKWNCTYRIYKMIRDKQKKAHRVKLNVLCSIHNIELDHHDALSDSIACAHLFIKSLRAFGK